MRQAMPLGAVLFVGGPPQSGKSTLMWDCYTRHAPRVVTVEVVDETESREAAGDTDREVFRVFGYGDTRAALSKAAELRCWHVIASLDRDEIEQLFYLLCPPLRSRETVSYARTVGGMVLACGELAYLAPNPLGNKSVVKEAYLRYAHNWLSIYGATQHIPDVDPCTRMSADRCVFLRTQDTLGLDAIKRATTREVADLCRELPEYHSATCFKRLGRVYVADEHYRVYDVRDYRGGTVSRAEGAPHSVGVGTTGETNGRHSGRARLAVT